MAAAIREAIADRDSKELATVAARTMTRFIALPFRVLRPAVTDTIRGRPELRRQGPRRRRTSALVVRQ